MKFMVLISERGKDGYQLRGTFNTTEEAIQHIVEHWLEEWIDGKAMLVEIIPIKLSVA